MPPPTNTPHDPIARIQNGRARFAKFLHITKCYARFDSPAEITNGENQKQKLIRAQNKIATLTLLINLQPPIWANCAPLARSTTAPLPPSPPSSAREALASRPAATSAPALHSSTVIHTSRSPISASGSRGCSGTTTPAPSTMTRERPPLGFVARIRCPRI